MPRRLLAVALLALLPAVAPAEEKFFPLGAGRILFLGDSITYAGDYVAHVDAYLFTRFPDRKWQVINVGLPSETASGLTEPDHPFPRPDVHERLARALKQTKPDLIVACYGMNDGIYYPFDKLRTRMYHEGIRKLYRVARKAGARVTLMTPPPFDPGPIKEKLRPAGAKEYSYKTPFADYDDVLARYAEWMVTLRREGVPVVDVHAAIARALARVRKKDPKYHLAGDGIHPNATGHWLIAAALLRGWNAPAEVDTAEIDAGAGKTLRGEVHGLKVEGGTLSFRWKTRVPMPADPRWDDRVVRPQEFADQFNRHRLIVKGLPGQRYTLYEGDVKLGTVTAKELSGGVDLLKFPALSTNKRAAELWPLVLQRERLLARAWLSAVGHKRPGTPKGLPLEEARSKAGELEKKIRKLASPVEVSLRLVPARD
jgi:lysophospholipase L1-like esterase